MGESCSHHSPVPGINLCTPTSPAAQGDMGQWPLTSRCQGLLGAAPFGPLTAGRWALGRAAHTPAGCPHPCGHARQVVGRTPGAPHPGSARGCAHADSAITSDKEPGDTKSCRGGKPQSGELPMSPAGRGAWGMHSCERSIPGLLGRGWTAAPRGSAGFHPTQEAAARGRSLPSVQELGPQAAAGRRQLSGASAAAA